MYDITDKKYAVGLFFPVNESTWEHLKLLFFPALVYFTLCYFLIKEKPKNYISASLIGVIAGMFAIVVLFYTYRGVIGKNIDFLNIAIYYIGVLITVITQKKLLESQKFKTKFSEKTALILTIIIGIIFAVFSFHPPTLGIFIPPVS